MPIPSRATVIERKSIKTVEAVEKRTKSLYQPNDWEKCFKHAEASRQDRCCTHTHAGCSRVTKNKPVKCQHIWKKIPQVSTTT